MGKFLHFIKNATGTFSKIKSYFVLIHKNRSNTSKRRKVFISCCITFNLYCVRISLFIQFKSIYIIHKLVLFHES